ncbi:MAG: hypothetical protein IJ761_00195 [Bacteroidales bacterium]|nr:hypothetical protein [Bacteroidales bacterium]
MIDKERLKKCRLYTGEDIWPELPGMLGFFWEAEANWANGRHLPLNEGESAKSLLERLGTLSIKPEVPHSLLIELFITLRRVLVGKGYNEGQIEIKFASLLNDYIKTTSK